MSIDHKWIRQMTAYAPPLTFIGVIFGTFAALTPAQSQSVPAPTATTLGGVFARSVPAGSVQTGVDTTGAPVATSLSSLVTGVPADLMTHQSPGTGAQAKAVGLFLNQTMLSADVYGADPTGAADSTSAIQNAISAAASFAVNGSGRPTVFACGKYKISGTIINTGSGVVFQGCGPDGNHNISYARSGTTLVWAGAAGGTMISWASPGGAGSTHRFGGGVENVKLDGAGLAGRLLDVASWGKANFVDLTLYNPQSGGYGLYVRTVSNLGEQADSQFNLFSNISCRTVDVVGSTAKCLMLDGDGTASPASNTSLNTFQNIDTFTLNGPGIDCVFCDNNTFINTRTVGGSGATAKGVILRATSAAGYTYGGANGNTFVHLTAPNGVTSEGTEAGTHPAVQNTVIGYDTTNGSPPPTIGAGSTLVVQQTNPAYNPSWIPVLSACTPGSTPPTFSLTEARFVQELNSTVNFNLTFAESNKGTGSGCIQFTLPTPSISNGAVVGRESLLGRSLIGSVTGGSSNVQLRYFDASDPNANGDNFVVSGSYELKP